MKICSNTIQRLYSAAIFLFVSILSLPLKAEIIEVTGHANIINGNVDKAREVAISQALSYASMQAGVGVNVNSQYIMGQGQVSQDAFQFSHIGQDNNIELVSEMLTSTDITVLLRLELQDDSAQQCRGQQLRAAIMVPQASIQDRAQLRYGQLLNFTQALSQQYGVLLNSHSHNSFARIHADEALDHSNELINFKGNRIPSWLGEITDSQYILQPEILDMSTEPTSGLMFGLFHGYPQRQISFKLTLYHAISGEKVWSKYYSAQAQWEFERDETVSPTTKRFWRSSYGQTVNQLMQQSTADIDNLLNCRPLLGQIVAKQGDRIIINLGRKHHVRPGDSFQIVLQQNIPDRVNLMRAVATPNRATVTIDQVSEESATAVLQGIDATGNIQIQDIVIKI
ncbi:flagellar assembly protein T N-terminal domain-containing protein [Shewanella sp. UCD-KL21]|uniref:flagellar assembly protein T N-terminal domain-containing protein n=1 Tax=Shewanella sp. UCD-KL21 TaxID=1917164 RepID=UPI000970F880|nr:flagellar assembly protein T N-terminal domain-containing protein [Shewanella sp. UCD-KL21]